MPYTVYHIPYTLYTLISNVNLTVNSKADCGHALSTALRILKRDLRSSATKRGWHSESCLLLLRCLLNAESF